jgi:hypothetical protein
MTHSELTECMADIESRWPDQLNNAVAGDLRSVLINYEYESVFNAIREVKLESNYKGLPVGKIITACKKGNPNAGRPKSETSIKWDIFIQDRSTGFFSQLCTPGNYDHDRAMRAAETMSEQAAQQLGEEFIVVQGATIQEMVKSRTNFIKDKSRR